MNKHTPTPWTRRNAHIVSIDESGRRTPVAVCAFPTGDYRAAGEQYCDAEFIVRCVNSHDALVKALQTARKMIPFDHKLPGIIEIDAALAAAGAPQ